MWKDFHVGEGKFVRYDKLMKRGTSQESTRLEVVEPFTSPRVSTGFLYKNSKTTENKVNLVNSVALNQAASSYSNDNSVTKPPGLWQAHFLHPKGFHA